MEISRGYKAEIPSQIIFEQMKDCSYDFFQKNKNGRINLKLKGYFQQRNYIINLIKRITDELRFKSRTFFLSIHYLDILILESPTNSLFKNFPSLALACLVIASKYCENDPNVPQLPYFIRVFNSIADIRIRNTISISNLIYNEVKICKILNYQLNYYTIYDYNSFFFGHGILKLDQLKEIKLDDDIPFSTYAKKILEKIYKKSRNYLDIIINKKICIKYNSLLLSIFIMQKSVESIIFNESKINDDFEKIQIKQKTCKYFKEIMNNFYKIDYDSMEQYQIMKKELEQYNYNSNTIQKFKNSLDSNKIIKNNLTLAKLNQSIISYNNINKKILAIYNSNIGKDFIFKNYLNNSINLSKYINENKKLTEENELNQENANKEKLKYNSELKYLDYYYINSTNKKSNNNNFVISGVKENNKEKRFFSSNKYSNFKSLNNNLKYFSNIGKNNSFYNNNYKQNLASSVNLNNYEKIFFFKNLKSKSISPDKNSGKDVLYLNKNNRINKYENFKLINETEENKTKKRDFKNLYNNISYILNSNIKNDNNDTQSMNINKLYFKEFHYNNNDGKKKKSYSTNKINKQKNKLIKYKVNNNDNQHIKLNKKLDTITIQTKSYEKNFNINKRYANNLLSPNHTDSQNNDKEKENNKDDFCSNNEKKMQKDILNIKDRNSSNYKIKNLNILSSNDYPLLKIESLKNENIETYIAKLKKILENKKHNFNLYNEKNELRTKGKLYIKTDINEFHTSTSIINNLIKKSSKDIEKIKKKSTIKLKKLINKKCSYKKIKSLKSENLSKKTDKLNRFHEYNIITFLGNHISYSLNFHGNYINKKSSNQVNNTEEIKNKNKIIINNNINNNCNKFDNETISFNSSKNINKLLNFNSTEQFGAIQQKNIYKECKEFNIDETKYKNSSESKTTKNNNSITNNINYNKNIFSTIEISNNININLDKKPNSKEKLKFNFKLKKNTLKNFHRNNDNKLSKKSENCHKTVEKLNNKNLSKIKTNFI